ncbi:heat shock factor protein-like [Euwallacea fornicatus]|uniref:heat shock factor protein-like n=1 Tax=Euwallacea fornicatus TaxID=995702 RepID=UPI00338FC03F
MCNKEKKPLLFPIIDRPIDIMSVIERDGKLPNLPKLIEILWTAINDPKMQHFISWNTADSSFIINNTRDFEEKFIRQIYSKNCSYRSFHRQMYVYGFQRHYNPAMQSAHPSESTTQQHWFSPYFQRDRVDLLGKLIVEKKINCRKKKIAPSLKQKYCKLPRFLKIMWTAINDPMMHHLISWNSAGNSIITKMMGHKFHQKFVLEKLSRKCTLQSFYRQMKVYGFKMIRHYSIKCSNQSRSYKDYIKWYHPYFQKDKFHLVQKIQRTTKRDETIYISPHIFAKVKHTVKGINHKQKRASLKLSTMQKGNAVVWTELARLKLKQSKQDQMICKTSKFLNILMESPILPLLLSDKSVSEILPGSSLEEFRTKKILLDLTDAWQY